MRTMASLKSSKWSSASVTASKIKNKKILGPYFTKVSLMNNNKALALDLQVQKQRYKQLEMEVVNLQKQVVAMSFERATVGYKEKKLRLIFESLQSNARNMYTYLNMGADLFSDGALPKLSDDNLSGDVDKENLVAENLTDQLPPQLEMPSYVFKSQNNPRKSMELFNDNTDAEKRHSRRFKQASQSGTYWPSSSLRDEVENLSVMFPQSGFHMKLAPCLQNSPNSSAESLCEKPQPSLSNDVPSSAIVETQPEHINVQEKTMFPNTTMEMTLGEDNEIVTVESQGKKMGSSRELSSSVSTNQQEKNSAYPRMKEVQSDALGDIRNPKPKTKCRKVVTSRIPKLMSESGKHQKATKDKLKSRQHKRSKTRPHDIAKEASNDVELPPENDMARSNITCRRTTSKGEMVSFVTRKTFVILPPLSLESRSELEQVHNEEYQELPESSLYVEQDLMPSTGSPNCEAEELSTVMDAGDNLKHSDSKTHRQSEGASINETSSSWKHPWLATLSGGPQEDLRRNDSHEGAPLDLDCTSVTELQRPEKARRGEMTSENKAVQRKGSVAHLNDRKRKKSRSCSSNKRFRSTDEDRYLDESGDPSPLRGRDGAEINKEHLDDLQVVESHSDVGEKDGIIEHLYDSEPNGSMARMAQSPQQYRKTSNLQTPAETRKPRETFVVYRRKTQDIFPLDHTRMSNELQSHTVDTSGEAVLQNRGDLLTNEMPPWLDMEVSIADTEVSSLVGGRREKSGTPALIEESATVTTEASPAGRVLTSLTNTMTSPHSDNKRQTRRRKGAINYKEPKLNRKMRR